jgi:hypothetical protein
MINEDAAKSAASNKSVLTLEAFLPLLEQPLNDE